MMSMSRDMLQLVTQDGQEIEVNLSHVIAVERNIADTQYVTLWTVAGGRIVVRADGWDERPRMVTT